MSIRTTITLDDDIYAKLKRASTETGGSFRDVVNETIRLGFLAKEIRRSEPAFQIKPRSLGAPKVQIIKLEDALEFNEGPFHR